MAPPTPPPEPLPHGPSLCPPTAASSGSRGVWWPGSSASGGIQTESGNNLAHISQDTGGNKHNATGRKTTTRPDNDTSQLALAAAHSPVRGPALLRPPTQAGSFGRQGPPAPSGSRKWRQDSSALPAGSCGVLRGPAGSCYHKEHVRGSDSSLLCSRETQRR